MVPFVDLQAQYRAIKAEIDEAVEYAENAPYADPEVALERVYAEG